MRIRTLLVALAAMLLACSGSDPEASASGDGSPSPTSSLESTTTTTSSAPPSSTTTTTEPPPPFVATDFGVDDDEIRVGASADLTGRRAGVTAAMIDGQVARFDVLNAAGGIADRHIVMVVRDHASDLETHIDNYVEFAEESEAGVVILSATGDEEQTAAILPEMAAASLVGVTSSHAAAWATSGGANVLELGASTCVEAMNGIEFLRRRLGADDVGEPAAVNDGGEAGETAPTVAIVSRPGTYGEEGAAGARHAANELGLETVADLDGRVGPQTIAELTEILIDADPDIVWVTVSPPELAELIVGATAGGLDAEWSGNEPSYNAALLATTAAPVLAERYVHSALSEQWGSPSPAMRALRSALVAELPDGTYDEADAYLAGWLQASVVVAALEEAAAAEDMTRSGVAAAAQRLSLDFDGVAPQQSWGTGAPIVRSTYLYEIVPDAATLERSLAESGSTGLRLLDGPNAGTIAAAANPATTCNTVRAG